MEKTDSITNLINVTFAQIALKSQLCLRWFYSLYNILHSPTLLIDFDKENPYDGEIKGEPQEEQQKKDHFRHAVGVIQSKQRWQY